MEHRSALNSNVLVLNRFYMAIRVVDVRRAQRRSALGHGARGDPLARARDRPEELPGRLARGSRPDPEASCHAFPSGSRSRDS